jgi:hypothetical protein
MRLAPSLNNGQAGNYLEVAQVERDHGIVHVQRRRADQQILKRNADPKRRLLTFDASRQFCDFSRHRNHRISRRSS